MDRGRAVRLPREGARVRGRPSTARGCAASSTRDIKPKNVRLNVAGQVKVLDFGIAKGLALSRKLTRNDFGSLAYLSPERLDSGEVDVHVDFWSVGVLLYEMLAAAPPFEADTNSKLEALIRRRQPPAPLPDSCPPALARIVLKMLAGDHAPPLPVGGRRCGPTSRRSATAPRRRRTASGPRRSASRRRRTVAAAGRRMPTPKRRAAPATERPRASRRRRPTDGRSPPRPSRRLRGPAAVADGTAAPATRAAAPAGRWAGAARVRWRPRRSSRASRSSGTRRSCGARPRNCA